MISKMRVLLTFVIDIVCICTVVTATCTIDKSISNTTIRTQQETLLQRLSPILGDRSEPLIVNGHEYDFVVCGDVDPQHTGVSLLQKVPGSKDPAKVLGLNNQTQISADGSWLMLTLQGGDTCEDPCNVTQRQTDILFVCDPFQSKVQIRTIGNCSVQACHLQFVVAHKILCPKAPEEGLGGGAIFFILLLVTLGAYFMFGFFYLRLVKGAKGIEQIPNIQFWFKMGNILSDGCGAICRCDQYCGGGNAAASTPTSYNGYSPIEERMARDLQETDRDSALLSP